MIIAHNTKTDKIDVSNTLTDLCKRHEDFKYQTLKEKKFPFDYKGWRFDKVDCFGEWYNNLKK